MRESRQGAEVRLVPGAERILDDAISGEVKNPDLYGLRLQAEYAVLVAGFEQLVCLETLEFTPFDYQILAAQAALRRFRGRGLLCDEVGLGKTIEAGLVLKEYLMRQVVRRVLIMTPPALVEQWREELAVKFHLDDFVTSTDARFRELGPQAWAEYPRVIASLATARRQEHRALIEKIPYDMVILDEAHHFKNRSSVSWKFVNRLQRKYVLMLTATPVQNNLNELYNLITLLKPGQLKSPAEFRRQFVVRGDPRQPKNRGRLRELLADVMVRHSRGQVHVDLPPRQATTIRLELTPEERTFYDQVSDVVRRGFRLAAAGTSGAQAAKFTLQILQREIGSSAEAAESTLRALADQPRMDPLRHTLLTLSRQSADVRSWAKAEALKKLLEKILGPGCGAREKVIIFTHFRRTVERLAAYLRRLDVAFALYHGGLSSGHKDRAVRDFETDVPVLLSTEAAGEGRNLQFCRIMINFDLPWNPMRIEQRVGRIHRIGQTREVHVYNLSARRTVEDYLLEILDHKLNMFELVIGEMDMILGKLADEREFEELVLDAWVRGSTPEEVSAGFEQLGETMAQARRDYRRTKEYDESLFGGDFSAA